MLKRSYFKTKPRKQIKRGKLKKVSKQKISTLQVKLWEQCRRIIKEKYGNVCYTCGAKELTSSNWQIGHLLPKASLGANLKYDLRILRPQCFRCNINMGGNGAIFSQNIRNLEGEEYLEKILQDRQKTVKAYDWYEQLLEQYKLL